MGSKIFSGRSYTKHAALLEDPTFQELAKRRYTAFFTSSCSAEWEQAVVAMKTYAKLKGFSSL